MFPITSRYHNIEKAEFRTRDRRTIVYLRRRFLPLPDRFAVLQTYTVTDGDRLDNITARFLEDPEQFWRIADANNAMHPRELEKVGRTLRITLPEGIPGVTDA